MALRPGSIHVSMTVSWRIDVMPDSPTQLARINFQAISDLEG
jgi:hypothetical protein